MDEKDDSQNFEKCHYDTWVRVSDGSKSPEIHPEPVPEPENLPEEPPISETIENEEKEENAQDQSYRNPIEKLKTSEWMKTEEEKEQKDSERATQGKNEKDSEQATHEENKIAIPTKVAIPAFGGVWDAEKVARQLEELKLASKTPTVPSVPYKAMLPSRVSIPPVAKVSKKKKKQRQPPEDPMTNIGTWNAPGTSSSYNDTNFGVWDSEKIPVVEKLVEEPKEPYFEPNSTLDFPEMENRRIEEYQKNIFSQFYPPGGQIRRKPKTTAKHSTIKEIRQFTHSEAIDFAAATHFWQKNSHGHRQPAVEEAWALPTFSSESGTRAYYRLIAEKGEKYVMMACHVNVHGFHRADLRFVEVSNRTQLKGFEGRSVVGHMLLGDIVAVTEMARIRKLNISDVRWISQDTKCQWLVRKMTLMQRKLVNTLTFSFLHNGMAIAKGYDEAMNVLVDGEEDVQLDRIFVGDAFIPEKMEFNYCQGHDKKQKRAIASLAAEVPAYPNAWSTIYSFDDSPLQNRLFEIGTDAFSSESVEDREKVVETCVLMGCAAANAVFNGRFDCRSFSVENASRQGQVLTFSIENPPKQPTLQRWRANDKIILRGANCEANATIESVISIPGDLLKVVARLARGVNRNLDFRSEEFVVCQREPPDYSVLKDDFFVIMSQSSNARKIIETLYGGAPIQMDPDFQRGTFEFPSTPPIQLNEFQNEYVSMILAKTPLVLGSSPFGCGKSMTIVTAAFEVHKRNVEESLLKNDKQQLLVTQSNYASVNLIDIAQKAHILDDNVKFVRYVSERNWKELPDACRTAYDMPKLMEIEFKRWATGDLEPRKMKKLELYHQQNMISFLLENEVMPEVEIIGNARKVLESMNDRRKTTHRELLEAFFILYRPDIIMVTADSALQLLDARVLKEVVTVQIDEASQLPEYTLFCLLVSFPKACFGLIGDIHQLPPYCVDELRGRLKQYGIGNTMERAVKGTLFPKAILRYVYRCHPKTTKLLSELFYDGDLLSGVTELERSEFMRSRLDFWPNPNYPMIIVDNKHPGYSMGTSKGNRAEATLAQQIVRFISTSSSQNAYCVHPKDIGVISFYSAQTSVLTEVLRGSGVKCGTVDAFQGSEREVIIVCCTNERLSEFMQLSNRLNVAMSRARQATIIIGNLDGLRKAKYWNKIVKRAEEHGCLVDTTKYPFRV